MKKQLSVCKEEGFNKIYYSYSKMLFNFMYYKCGDSNAAEDFVQESFVRLWDNCAKVIFSKAKSYLFTIANNLFLKNANHKKVIFKHRRLSPESKSIETPEFLIEEREFKERLEKIIAELPVNQREVFLLNRIDEKKYREIAELLDISVKTVEKRMSLALKSLKTKLAIPHKI